MVFQVRYKTITFNDTIANTFNNGKICTAEVMHNSYIGLKFFEKDSFIYTFYLNPVIDFDYVLKKVTKKYDGLTGGWLKDKIYEPSNFDTDIKDPATNKIPHKTVIIHGKNIEVIDTKGKTPEQVFIHEDKGIVAMIIPNHGTGYWVVDKIE